MYIYFGIFFLLFFLFETTFLFISTLKSNPQHFAARPRAQAPEAEVHEKCVSVSMSVIVCVYIHIYRYTMPHITTRQPPSPHRDQLPPPTPPKLTPCLVSGIFDTTGYPHTPCMATRPCTRTALPFSCKSPQPRRLSLLGPYANTW